MKSNTQNTKSDSEWQHMKNGAEITTYDETGNEEFRYSIHED